MVDRLNLLDEKLAKAIAGGQQAHHTLLDNGINHLIPLLGWQIIAIDLPNQTAQ